MRYNTDIFHSDVDDITNVLDITVLDENKRTKSDFLGKVRFLSYICFNFSFSLNDFRCLFHS